MDSERPKIRLLSGEVERDHRLTREEAQGVGWLYL
jgi:hypothetical protein